MKTRGRPRHPETLTPRQQEVLALLRQGLTNEEIAARLGITLDGAKFHVSEILLRLGVDSRYEAATWSPEAAAQPARGRWAFALAPLALLHKLKWNAAGAIAAGALALAAGVGIALLIFGLVRTNDDRAAARIGAADPAQVIFATLAAGDQPGTRTRWTITVYDSAARRIAHQFDIGDGINDQPSQVVAAGDKLVANLSDRIVRYHLDGSNALELWRTGDDGTWAFGLAASPDGTRIAYSTHTPGACERVQQTPAPLPEGCRISFVEGTAFHVRSVATGEETFSMPQTDPQLADLEGYGTVLKWRGDGTGFAVIGAVQHDGAGGMATVMLDGTATMMPDDVDQFVPRSPDARFQIASDMYICSGLDIARHRIAIVDDGTELARVVEPDRDVAPLEWSPDGDTLLYYTVPMDPPENTGGCGRHDNEGDDGKQWHILSAAGVTDVADADAARQLWYGDRAIQYRCQGEPTPWPACIVGGSYGAVDVLVGGLKVATAQGQSFQLIQQIAPDTTR